MKRLGILLSGRGSNFIAIADAIAAGTLTGCAISVVISNVADAPGIIAARQRGIPTEVHVSRGVSRAAHDASMIDALNAQKVDLVILAGYMRVLSPDFIRAFPGRILNIHPSLLPSFPGLHAQRQALAYGAKVAGCTVHFVDEAVDHGVIILQRAIPVRDDECEETLSARILMQEHTAYAEAIQQVVDEKFSIEQRRFRLLNQGK